MEGQIDDTDGDESIPMVKWSKSPSETEMAQIRPLLQWVVHKLHPNKSYEIVFDCIALGLPKHLDALKTIVRLVDQSLFTGESLTRILFACMVSLDRTTRFECYNFDCSIPTRGQRPYIHINDPKLVVDRECILGIVRRIEDTEPFKGQITRLFCELTRCWSLEETF